MRVESANKDFIAVVAPAFGSARAFVLTLWYTTCYKVYLKGIRSPLRWSLVKTIAWDPEEIPVRRISSVELCSLKGM